MSDTLKEIFALAQQEINAQEEHGNTALMLAASNGYKEVVRALLDKGANPNLQNKGGTTALILAAEVSDKEVVRALLDKGANPNLQNNSGETALMKALHGLKIRGSKEVVQMLLDKGANPNLQDKYGNTALSIAATRCDAETMDILKREMAVTPQRVVAFINNMTPAATPR